MGVFSPMTLVLSRTSAECMPCQAQGNSRSVSKPVSTYLTDPQVGRMTWASEMQRFLKDSCSWACCLSLLAMGLETVLINRLAERGDGLSQNR